MGFGDGDRFTAAGRATCHWVGTAPPGCSVPRRARAAAAPGSADARRQYLGPVRGLHSDENPSTAAAGGGERARSGGCVQVHGFIEDDHGDWASTRCSATARCWTCARLMGNRGAAWVPVSEVTKLRLFPQFASICRGCRMGCAGPVLVVDCPRHGFPRRRVVRDGPGRRDGCATSSAGPRWTARTVDRWMPEIVLVGRAPARGSARPTRGPGGGRARLSGDDAGRELVAYADPDERYLVYRRRELRARARRRCGDLRPTLATRPALRMRRCTVWGPQSGWPSREEGRRCDHQDGKLRVAIGVVFPCR